MALAVSAGALVFPGTSAFSKDFDGQWSVNIVAANEECPTQVIPVLVSDGTVSFSAFGATASGVISSEGAVDLRISFNDQTVQVSGKVRGSEGSGSWRSKPAGCEGRWSAEIAQ